MRTPSLECLVTQNNMTPAILKHARNTALTLMGFAALFTILLSVVYTQTLAPIAESEAQARMALFQQIVPPHLFDNALLNDTQALPVDPLLGNSQPIMANIARIQGVATAVIFEVTAHDGYSGDIKLLLAVEADGRLAGVRVLSHKETPGLGDYIDIAKDRWITLFDGLSLQAVPTLQWKVKKDGGQFDYRAGATITPRAVVGAVAKALAYVQQHHDSLFGPAPRS